MFLKIGVVVPPKMDGSENGKPYFLNGWFGGTIIFGNTRMEQPETPQTLEGMTVIIININTFWLGK